ncbi:uncharacterized protein [Prorops nasuta]|uniref:uncharacterized protein n=1 Tax=Prorops nasuta TaxID=863751 RepID=UPI0034CF091F
MANSGSLLPTAQVWVINHNGLKLKARALLDQASEVTLITEALAQALNLVRRRVSITVVGVGASKHTTSRSTVSFRVQSNIESSFELEVNAFVLTKITNCLPSEKLAIDNTSAFAKLLKADPDFHIPGEVNLLLGVDVYAFILRQGFQNIDFHNLVAQNTALGWIFSGSFSRHSLRIKDSNQRLQIVSVHSLVEDSISKILELFWAIEEVQTLPRILSPEDEYCERFFQNTHFRNSEGRYILRLPLKSELPKVADQTRRLAITSFYSLRRRFNRDPELARDYCAFMDQYENLGHMQLVPEDEIVNERAWYLPHHAIVSRISSSQKKFRVVFNASRRISNQKCLNDFLLPGPILQSDLSLILTSWRQHRFVFTADIVKMFRQVLINKSDQDLLRILWSSNPNLPPRDYRLTTVTYGTSCAPYLAIKTLLQLAKDEEQRYPLGAQCIQKQIYVDDIFSGSDDLNEAISIRDQLISLLELAGIKLGKWASNSALLYPKECKDTSLIESEKPISVDQTVKTLGLIWHPVLDTFNFNTEIVQNLVTAPTKRVVLSNLARLFDPLGWLTPVVINAKILLQDIWILKLEWDAPLPLEIASRWKKYNNYISRISELSISRWLGTIDNSSCELHGFSDASMRAYAAVIYLRVIDKEGSCKISIIMAKSKVAPVKTKSIPNLELCGAVLLVKLFKHLRKIDFYKKLPITAWCDSRDVLAWINKHPSHWKVFVANRTSYIQTELPNAVWNDVSTKENPADLATRGVDPDTLKSTSLWWTGPHWLSKSSSCWPKQPSNEKVSEPVVKSMLINQLKEKDTLLDRFSSLMKLFRVAAYCLRFIVNCRNKKKGLPSIHGFLSSQELQSSRICLIRLAQSSAFPDDLIRLKNKQLLPRKSVLQKLRPFLDEYGIIRVGGRLTHSSLPFPVKHPAILPKRSHLSQLFIKQAHVLALHGGPALTMGTLLQHVWIIGARSLVKRHVRACIRCHRARPRLATQLMGDLPSSRITPSRPFMTTGLDYAGPFWLKMSGGRGQQSYKGYICLFVCFCTKAIHLEAVSDLSTQTLLAAYRRFVSRRGFCGTIYSDNGTNFQGADKELQTMFTAYSKFYHDIAEQLAMQGTSWSFIPPNSPHFGGLRESGVKATKHHLLRVIGEHKLTFEEFSTALSEIEAAFRYYRMNWKYTASILQIVPK